jgi:hypothetical protein
MTVSQHSKPHFMSVIPNLVSHSGHSLSYHLAAERAVVSLGWQFTGIVQVNCRPAPAHWRRMLISMGDNNERQRESLLNFHKGYQSYVRALISSQRPNTIVFLEQFNLAQLVATSLACARHLNKSCAYWLMYRHDVSDIGTSRVHKTISRVLARRLGKRFMLLTDSFPLADRMKITFGLPTHVLPIPHSFPPDSLVRNGLVHDSKKVVTRAYAPGRVAIEKGSDIISRIATYSIQGNLEFELATQDTTIRQVNHGPKIVTLPESLSNHEYWQSLRDAHLILLPYTHPRYSMATSGVFVEAITLGKVPVVMENTWMASELRSFGLDSLILSSEQWHNEKVWQRLYNIHVDISHKIKLSKMQKYYIETHCEAAFAGKLLDWHVLSLPTSTE